eukprot:Gregarina_sp_Poly_1__11400@NODE_96_length_14647_cov_152_270302_g83_i0_p8_GENE_NODE_96_length_14647_cov_152_270302_g83_i0NODE_96_length_14647_cov_152_270302_g83_i0_p8_ORF_typecomplete_len228_score45_27LSM/PF01423_22/3_8e12LSM/PF01423_22/8_7e02DUF3391/PF11871_8/0_53HAT/PF02184_16/2_1e03HAT/PF02184_16/0_66_NODE_96_length_14647_cov_152_270302_g83_i055266209
MSLLNELQGSWVKSLEEDSQQAVLVLLKDNKTFVGILKTFDHFGNILLDRCCERLFNPRAPNEFAEVYLGCVLIRGENIVLFGTLADLQPHQHFARISSFSQRGLIGGEPPTPVPRGIRVFEVPLATVLVEQEERRKLESHAEQVWINYKSLLKSAEAEGMDDEDSQKENSRSLEKSFIEGLLAKSSSTQTEREVEVARSLFHRYVQAASDALAVVERKRSATIETE